MRRVMLTLVLTSLLLGLVLAAAPGCGKKAANGGKNPAAPDLNAKANALKASGMDKKWMQNPNGAKSGAGATAPAPAAK
jgi:hypothetical protein